MDTEDPFNSLVEQSFALDNVIAERSSQIKVLESKLLAIEGEKVNTEKTLQQLESDLRSKDKELDLLNDRQKSLEEQLVLLEGVRAQLRNEIMKQETLIQEKMKQYNASLAKYDAIWEGYEEKYKTFPRVSERDALQKQVRCKEIFLKIQLQELNDKRRKVRQLEEIRALRGRVLSYQARELYTKHEELKDKLTRMKSENEERRSHLRAKQIQKQEEEQQRLAREEQQKKENEKLQLSNLPGSSNGRIDIDSIGESKKTSFTFQDLPVLKIPEFDLEDIAQAPVQFLSPLSGLSQIKSSLEHEQMIGSVPSVKSQSLPAVNLMHQTIPASHLSTPSQQTTEYLMSTPISSLSNSELSKADPIQDTSVDKRSSAISEKSAVPHKDRGSSSLSHDFEETSKVVEPMPHIVTGTPSHKKELLIKTDNIVAKWKDLVKHKDAEASSQDVEGTTSQSLTKTDEDEKHSEKKTALSSQGEIVSTCKHLQDEGQLLSSETGESEAWSGQKQNIQKEEECDNLMLRKDVCSPDKATFTSSKELSDEMCIQSGDEAYAFNTDYDALYDDNSFGPPPDFGAPSTSDSDVGYTTPILSPMSEDVEPPSTISHKGKEHQPYGEFSFFSSTTNIFGGPSNNGSNEENIQTKTTSFFHF